MQGVKTKSGLPQPYNMKPKNKGFLTTPMKKLIAYIFVLLIFGYIIYEISPKPEKEDPKYELDSQAKVQENQKSAKNVIDKEKLGDIDLADAHMDSNHKIE